MPYSATRLTLYAVLSGIEDDMRRMIREYLADQLSAGELLGTELLKRCEERLARDLGTEGGAPATDLLITYMDFGDGYAILNAHAKLLPPPVAFAVRAATPKLQRLVDVRNRVMHSRPLQFDDLAMTLDVATDLANDRDSLWTDTESVLARLKQEPSFVLGLDIPTYASDITSHKHNLPLPDFDETGFIGRKRQVTDLIGRCLGPYPVISIVGEGGIGKTALAVKVAYDVLDLPNCPFDAIVWVTSKTSLVTPQEIVKIENAIGTSLGLFQAVAVHLAGTEPSNPTEEVLQYLESFKILLIIDNLETVLDNRIREFLDRLPSGSKVLMTSRIGLGSYEYRVHLEPLEDHEAVELLRALSRVRGVSRLAQTPNKQLSGYCQRMKNNPGFIKWFVSAVQAGARPEEVLAKPDLFLDFCLSNVYNYLDHESRSILQMMLCLPGRHSQAELAFLNDMLPIELHRALQRLLTTNMVTMTSVPRGLTYESQYELADLPRAYLSKHHPVDIQDRKKYTKRRQQLVALGEQLTADGTGNPYSVYTVAVRSRSDWIIAKYLSDALHQAMRLKDFSAAEQYVDRARSLAPDYYEVHRVDAWIKAIEGDISAAHSAYEAAVEIEPRSAPLRLWYGQFIMRYLDDTEQALEHFKVAAQIDQNAFEVQLELARSYLYLRDFDQSRALIDKLLDRPDLSAWDKRKVYDLHLGYYQRRADYLFSVEHDEVAALDALTSLRQAFLACSPHLVDPRMQEKLAKAVRTATGCAQRTHDDELRKEAEHIGDWLLEESQRSMRPKPSLADGQPLSGEIVRLDRDRGYGFIATSDGVRVFFHRSSLAEQGEWDMIGPGSTVLFVVDGSDSRGPAAHDVHLSDSGIP